MKIALIGLDGSGKSANIDMMKNDKDYSDFFFLWVRWKPSITRFLYRLKPKNENVGKRKDNKQAQKKYAKTSKKYTLKKRVEYIVFLIPFTKKIWMRFAIKDYEKQFNKKIQEYDLENSNFIFDRYYLDLFVDQGINFKYTPKKIGEEIIKYQGLFPLIDKTIYIRVSPKICYERKDDIPNMEYLKYRYRIYEYLAKKLNWIVIDGEKDLETVNLNIKKCIFK